MRGSATFRRGCRIASVAVLCAAALLMPPSAVSRGGGEQSLGSCQSGDVIVTIYDFGFSPNNVRIDPGQTVCWMNTSQAMSHTSTSDTGVWNSGLLAPGASYRFTFNIAGGYPYRCAPIRCK